MLQRPDEIATARASSQPPESSVTRDGLARRDRPEILIEPSQNVADQFVERWQVAPVVDRVPLTISRRAEQRE